MAVDFKRHLDGEFLLALVEALVPVAESRELFFRASVNPDSLGKGGRKRFSLSGLFDGENVVCSSFGCLGRPFAN